MLAAKPKGGIEADPDHSASDAELTRHDAHHFQGPPDADVRCRWCGEPKVQIRHHPTRVRAALLVRGFDPDAIA